MSEKVLVLENESLPSTTGVVDVSVKILGYQCRVDVTNLLASTLQCAGLAFNDKETYVEIDGLRLVPHFVDDTISGPKNELSFQTISTINIVNQHDFGLFRFFEYQHYTSSDMLESLKLGFKEWLEYEYPVAQSFNHKKVYSDCVTVSQVGGRVIYIGPVLNRGCEPIPSVFEDDAVLNHFVDCLTTLEYAFVKIFVSRDFAGNVEVDVRVNGADYPAGKEFIEQYAKENLVGEFIVKHYIGIC